MGDATSGPNPYEIPPVAPGPSGLTPEAKQMAMLAHLLGALFGFVGPLIIWLTQKDKHPFVDDQGKEALNFQLTLLIGYVISVVLYLIISFVTCGFGALLPIPLIVTVIQLIFGIIGCTKANVGEAYRYPFNIKFIQ
jgi:uncharacterized Tic20 family protein